MLFIKKLLQRLQILRIQIPVLDVVVVAVRLLTGFFWLFYIYFCFSYYVQR